MWLKLLRLSILIILWLSLITPIIVYRQCRVEMWSDDVKRIYNLVSYFNKDRNVEVKDLINVLKNIVDVQIIKDIKIWNSKGLI